jgi:hypothetical protein
MNFLRQFLFAWLAFLLLLAQQGAAVHALSHLADSRPAQQEKHLPHSPACDKCVVYASIGHGAASAPVVFALPRGEMVQADAVAPVFRSVTATYYRSRAPPPLA